MVTLEDIHLRDYTLAHLPLLARLRRRLRTSRPHVCVERAKWITRYFKASESRQCHGSLARAGAVAHYLSNKQSFFFDDNLLAGTTTSKHYGAPVYPELTGLAIWPELDTIGTRKANRMTLSPTDAETLNREIFPYWMDKNIVEYTRRKYGNPKCLKLLEQFIYFIAGKAGCISHVVPSYRTVLKKGIAHIIGEAQDRRTSIERRSGTSEADHDKCIFYRSMETVLKSVLVYADNLNRSALDLASLEDDPAEKQPYLLMAQVCRQVPASPATSFLEAVNAIWLTQIAIHAENINMAVSPGRLDQVLYPYFRQDIDAGTLDIAKALEIIGCLWLKLNDNTNLVPEASETLFGGAGTVPAVTVGGVDENGGDAVNDLTYIMLRVTELLQTRDPNLNARFHYKVNTRAYRDRLSEVIAKTGAVPAVHNDVKDIEVLRSQGIDAAHARDYAIIGCVELTSAGRSYDASSSIMFNLVSALELALFNGKRPVTGGTQISPPTGEPADFEHFEAFWTAFTRQFAWLAEQAIELNERFGRVHQEILATPLLSAFIDGPLENGRDLVFGGARYNASGATHIGFADTVDSLSAIEKAVFVAKKFTFPEILEAIRADFEGHEVIRAYLVHRTPKYGSRDVMAIRNSQRLVRFLFEFYQSHTNYRGGRYRPAYWTMTNHAGQGRLTGALPNGRKAGQAFSSGITPVSGAASDLAACFKAVGALDSRCIPGGQALNVRFPAVQGSRDVERLAQAIEAYMRLGGMHIQFNLISQQMLIDAQQNPEKYPELLVRVSGYSAYFRDLNVAMQNEIIDRTQYDLPDCSETPANASSESVHWIGPAKHKSVSNGIGEEGQFEPKVSSQKEDLDRILSGQYAERS
jgi:pyruvate formate-lyase/glycerol dehydratase family glycyl radical enzyme